MANAVLDIPQFVKYLNVSGLKDKDIHIVSYAEEEKQLLKSDEVLIDFYILSIKRILHKNLIRQELWDDQSNSYVYFDSPNNSIAWDIEKPSSGFSLMISSGYLKQVVKNYTFLYYTGLREALYFKKDEADLMWDLYQKAFYEFRKNNYSKDILLNYIALLLSYAQSFYDRQFAARSNTYNEVILDFYKNLKSYFNQDTISGIPSVAYFAQKSFLSTNYFGDLVKHITGKPPIEHIQNYIVDLAKQMLTNTRRSVGEISFSLGFEYPNCFARFFRKQTGISPRTYRKQYRNQ